MAKVIDQSRQLDREYAAERLNDLMEGKVTGKSISNTQMALVAGVKNNNSISYWRHAKQEPSDVAKKKIIEHYHLPEDYFHRPTPKEDAIANNLKKIFSSLDPETMALMYFFRQDKELEEEITESIAEGACSSKDLKDKLSKAYSSADSDSETFQYRVEYQKEAVKAISFLSEIDEDFQDKYPMFFDDGSRSFHMEDVADALAEMEDTYSRMKTETKEMKQHYQSNSNRFIQNRYPDYSFSINCNFRENGLMETMAFENVQSRIKPKLKSLYPESDNENPSLDEEERGGKETL